ncbi:hypothetical protein RSOLAG1IB_10846 [Rhizoctonia solani AG-1 IB]|uniref:Uncharacterized protein n=1 Tax=Thanatephorus cucumeris (strain AG1-IB / isolate 7/3/14) TaxID=1108050 RepID=M5BYB7_THACB|nr:hypothetical protein BN14_05631 [Rhizoctonia solani AG-1 IB]CEL63545.1 hypothetical protein RSOLAG1IB_10846 [Rhizoctonia solani AG-1 IB]
MPVYQSNAEPSFNHCIHVDFYLQDGPEAMKDNLGSAANIIHVLLNASNRRNIRRIRRNTYKHPRWGFMYWLDPKGKEGPQLLYGVRVYCWWHFLASTPIAFQDFAQWHRQGFLTPPPVISTALSATELCAVIVNLALLYPANSSTVPVSSPVSANALSDLEESLATPPAGATLLPSLQLSANSPPSQGLWQAPAPATDNWQLFSYKGWSKEEIQRHRQAFDPDYRQEEEMLYSFSEWL